MAVAPGINSAPKDNPFAHSAKCGSSIKTSKPNHWTPICARIRTEAPRPYENLTLSFELVAVLPIWSGGGRFDLNITGACAPAVDGRGPLACDSCDCKRFPIRDLWGVGPMLEARRQPCRPTRVLSASGITAGSTLECRPGYDRPRPPYQEHLAV